ncbi:adenylosuccinate synthetase [Spirochaetota bacterium]|nr:adenylosuccinate synthetase [Spirochaetota bacterium]
MGADILLGGQWGDEGKAKIVDCLARRYDIVVRYQGGANAGHTVKWGAKTYIFHQIPSGVLSEHSVNVLGNGMVLDLEQLCGELDFLLNEGINVENRLKISTRAFMVMPYHKLLDEVNEGQSTQTKIGTTKRGIGPAYIDKVGRMGLRIGDLTDWKHFEQRLTQDIQNKKNLIETYYKKPFPYTLAEILEQLKAYFNRIAPYIVDTTYYLNHALTAGKQILLEGAQGVGLDLDCGTYPYVTSSTTISGGALSGSGIGPKWINNVFGIFKAYTTRVGEGALPTLLEETELLQMQQLGHEFGATTGRPRKCGWFDGVQARYAVMVSGMTALALTKIDILSAYDIIKVATHYEINGNRMTEFPVNHKDLACARPIYKEFQGWKEPIDKTTRKYEDLPAKARVFIDFLEQFLNCPITMISIGPERTALIERTSAPPINTHSIRP